MKMITKPGWHKRGYIPRIDANTLVQHVIFRTQASLSPNILEETTLLDGPTKRRLIDSELDRSQNGLTFNHAPFADILQEGLRYFDHDRYDLQAWCIMPNHVHVLLVTAPDVLLGQIIKTWKSQATRLINVARSTQGEVFARDYFDRFMRTSEQIRQTIWYIEQNPVKAGLCLNAEDWIWSSSCARMRGWTPSYERMPIFLD